MAGQTSPRGSSQKGWQTWEGSDADLPRPQPHMHTRVAPEPDMDLTWTTDEMTDYMWESAGQQAQSTEAEEEGDEMLEEAVRMQANAAALHSGRQSPIDSLAEVPTHVKPILSELWDIV